MNEKQRRNHRSAGESTSKIITTHADINNLPFESVVRDTDGDWFERWAWPADDWRLFGATRAVAHEEMVLPVTVFHIQGEQ